MIPIKIIEKMTERGESQAFINYMTQVWDEEQQFNNESYNKFRARIESLYRHGADHRETPFYGTEAEMDLIIQQHVDNYFGTGG
jgi:hypothetical protein